MAECETCEGSGEVCGNCGEGSEVCDCGDQELQKCGDCDGTGDDAEGDEEDDVEEESDEDIEGTEVE